MIGKIVWDDRKDGKRLVIVELENGSNPDTFKKLKCKDEKIKIMSRNFMPHENSTLSREDVEANMQHKEIEFDLVAPPRFMEARAGYETDPDTYWANLVLVRSLKANYW